MQLGIGFAGVVMATIAGFYLPWALRSLTQLATEGSSQFAAEALTIGLLLLGATCLQAIGTSLAGYMNQGAGGNRWQGAGKLVENGVIPA